MWLSLQGIVAEKLIDLWSSLYPGMLLMVAACTAITLFSSQTCNPGKVWWRNRGLLVDVCYWLTLRADRMRQSGWSGECARLSTSSACV